MRITWRVERRAAVLLSVLAAGCAIHRTPEIPSGPATVAAEEPAQRAFYEVRVEPAPTIDHEYVEEPVRRPQAFAELQERIDRRPERYLLVRGEVAATRAEIRRLPAAIYPDSYETVMTRVILAEARWLCADSAGAAPNQLFVEGGTIPGVMSHGSSSQPALEAGAEYVFALRRAEDGHYLVGGFWDLLAVGDEAARDALGEEIAMQRLKELCR